MSESREGKSFSSEKSGSFEDDEIYAEQAVDEF